MSKIICDVCGTSYPETATQCPICGCVRPGDAKSVKSGVSGTSSGYTYVKGGRFSKSNVKKRMKGKAPATATVAQKKNNKQEEKSSRGLVITAIVLLLAIVVVVVGIALRYFVPFGDTTKPDDNKQNVENNESANSSDQTEETQKPEDNKTDDPEDNKNEKPQEVPCSSLTVDIKDVVFDKAGLEQVLTVTVAPLDTTDKVVYTSSNKAVATVSETGKIAAVGEGSAVITVSCGQMSASCTVTCKFEEDKAAVEEFRLNRMDITFGVKGDSWVLYSGTIANTAITWSTDNDAVATFEDGKVVAVGPGMTEVHAEYNGQKVSCIIRCSFEDESSGVGGNGGGITEDGGVTGNGSGITEDGGESVESTGSYAIYSQYGDPISQVTIKVGEILRLTLRDSSGNAIDASWSLSGSGCSLSGNEVEGTVAGSTANVSTTYNGVTYSCGIIVSG